MEFPFFKLLLSVFIIAANVNQFGFGKEIQPKKQCKACQKLVVEGAIVSCPTKIPNSQYQCNLTCDEGKGFKQQGGNKVRHCYCDGNWSKQYLTCKKPSKKDLKPCNYTTNLARFGEHNLNGCRKNVDGWQTDCDVSCKTDYEIADPKRKTINCDFKTGKWISNYNCTLSNPYDCEQLYDSNGRFFTCEEKNKTSPWKCGISCSTGFIEDNESVNQSRIVKCTSKREWDFNNTLTCSEMTRNEYNCSKEAAKGTTYECNTTVSSTHESLTYVYHKDSITKHTCKTKCMEGYFLREDNDPRECLKDGKWTKPLAKCYDTVYCKKPSATVLLVECKPKNGPPTECSVNCPWDIPLKNYLPKRATCLKNGTWDNWPKSGPECYGTK